MSDTFPKSKVLSMKDQVDYADGSIVSTQVIKLPAGNLTLFAFDKGQELSEHSAPFDALVQVLDGETEVRIAGEPYLLVEGQSIIMPADIPHAVKATARFKMLLSMIKS
jgi:quercetin dioxygenase-like cupin family protein